MIWKQSSLNNITLTKNTYDHTCSLTPIAKNVKLGNLGEMLGFAKDNVFTKDVQLDGTNPVDVHHGLRYVKLSTDIVDKSNVSFEGKRAMYLPHCRWRLLKDYFH